jgi:hypothetical protein
MHHSRMGFRRRRAVFLASIVVEPILMKLRGYPIGGMLVVRCREAISSRRCGFPACP